MSKHTLGPGLTWGHGRSHDRDSCWLPSAARPGRFAEFDNLFRDFVTFVERGQGITRLGMSGPPGLDKETLRCSERRGLIEKPLRSPGGHRLYDQSRSRPFASSRPRGGCGSPSTRLPNSSRSGTGVATMRFSRSVSEKLMEVEQRLSDRTTIRGSLLAAVDAGCEDLHDCAGKARCPIPFTETSSSPTKSALDRRRV